RSRRSRRRPTASATATTSRRRSTSTAAASISIPISPTEFPDAPFIARGEVGSDGNLAFDRLRGGEREEENQGGKRHDAVPHGHVRTPVQNGLVIGTDDR